VILQGSAPLRSSKCVELEPSFLRDRQSQWHSSSPCRPQLCTAIPRNPPNHSKAHPLLTALHPPLHQLIRPMIPFNAQLPGNNLRVLMHTRHQPRAHGPPNRLRHLTLILRLQSCSVAVFYPARLGHELRQEGHVLFHHPLAQPRHI
jgi:hypothetical protein